MLLRHTTSEVMERSALTINPAKTCQPIGAMYAALGVHNCLPHSHGSQGCCAYHRSTLNPALQRTDHGRHQFFHRGYVRVWRSSEPLQAMETMFDVYSPDVIAVHTTCLSETIGDDMVQIIGKAKSEGKVPEASTSFTRILRAMSARTSPASPTWRKRWCTTLPSRPPKRKSRSTYCPAG